MLYYIIRELFTLSHQNISLYRNIFDLKFKKYAYFSILLGILVLGLFPPNMVSNYTDSTKSSNKNIDSSKSLSMQPNLEISGAISENLDKTYQITSSDQMKCISSKDGSEDCNSSQNPNDPSLNLNNHVSEHFANFSSDQRISQLGISYEGTNTIVDNSTHLQKPNNYNWTTSPLQGQEYNLTLNIEAYSPETQYIGEQDWDSSYAIGDRDVHSQGIALPQLNYDAVFSFSEFSFGAVTAANNQEFVGAIYSSTCRSGCNQIIPDIPLATTTTTMIGGVSTEFKFTFNDPVVIESTDVLMEPEGGYVFFVIYPNENNVGGQWSIKIGADGLDGVDDGPTADFTASSGAPPSPLPSSASWFKDTTDYVFNYTAAVTFDPYQIDTKVSINGGTETLIKTDGTFNDNNSRSTDTDYLILYDSTKLDFTNTPSWIPSTTAAYFNITLNQYVAEQDIFYPTFSTSSTSNVVNWTINSVKSLDINTIEIPDTLSITNITKNTILLIENTDYIIVTSNGNSTINIMSGDGIYTIHATSPNMLFNATSETYIFDNGWNQANSSYMGVLDPTIEVGDHINATITNLGDLDLLSGLLNSSIRDPNKIINGNNSISGYTDQWLDSYEIPFVDTITFSTYLDPDIQIGVWVFEFHWFNGTAAGATAIEIDVLPITSMSLLTPNVIDSALEGDLLLFEVATYDQSHNSDWPNPGTITWEFGSQNLISQGKYIDNVNFLHNASIDLSISSNPIQPATYQFNVSFINGIYEQVISITIEIFYRGSSSITSPSIISFGTNFNLTLTPLNVTGGVNLNNSNLLLNMDIPFESSYNSTDGTYEVLVYWNGTIRAGNNSMSIRWSFNQYRNNASTQWVEMSFDFHVIDTTYPEFIETPQDIFVDDQILGNTLVWIVSELSPDIYTINKNDSYFDSGPWENATDIEVSLDGLSIGDYNFSIFIFDEAGNGISDWVWVYVRDLTAPNLVSYPNDRTFEEGTTGQTLSWTATDTYNDLSNFIIYENGAFYFSSAWISNSPITMTIRPLELGLYNYTIAIADDNNNQKIHSVFITVTDTQNPNITNEPEDLTYSAGTTGHTITWVAVDNNPSYYDLFIDEILISSSNPWSSSGSIVIDVNGLSNGNYNYTILIYDSSGNFDIDTVWVFVADVPVFTKTTGNYTYIENTTDHIVSWTLSDTDPDNYLIYFEDTLIKNGTWSNEIPIELNVTGLGIGIYNYTISINDTENNIVVNTLFVQVTDIPEIIDAPSNLIYGEGSPGNSLIWNSTDTLPRNYEVYLDEILFDTGNWNNSGTIEVIIDGLSKGTYNFTIIIYDETDNSILDSVLVTVIDNTIPKFVLTPSNATIIEGTVDNVLIWNTTDSYPLNFSLYINDIEILDGFWSSSTTIERNIDDLVAGTYNITIFVYDESLNLARYSITIDIIDTQDPILNSSPGNYTYADGSINNVLQWEAFDLHAFNYTLEINGVENITSSWVSNETISINLDGLSEGLYNFTIIIFDASYNLIIDTIFVTVTDIPKWGLTPDDINYAEGSFGNTFSWNATDSYPTSYEIQIDSTFYLSGGWNNETTVIIPIDNLSKGSYTITIIVYDASNNNNTYTFNVLVNDETKPNLINSVGNFTYFEGSVENYAYWNLNDTYPANYSIYRNNEFIESGNWTNGETLTILMDNLQKGLYNISIYFDDQSSNLSNHTFWITVIDKTSPNLIDPPTNFSYVEFSTGNNVTYTPVDLYPNYYDLYIDEIFNHTNSWSNSSAISINFDGFPLGEYNITIQIFDLYANYITQTILLSVIEITSPIFTSLPPNATLSEVDLDYTLWWNATDDHADNYQLYQNGTLLVEDDWTSNIPISYHLSSLLVGVHNFTIIAYDTSRNNITHSVYITIFDDMPPDFISAPDSFRIINEDSINNVLTWEVNDTNPDNYEILVNEQSSFVGEWNDTIVYSIDYLERGVYNITIIVYDKIGNSIINSTIITVLDIVLPAIIESSSDFSIVENQLGFNISWVFIDTHPLNYIIEMNGETVQNDIWMNNTKIIYFIPSLTIGVYDFLIKIYDDSGNELNQTVRLTVFDLNAPLIILQPNGFDFAEGDLIGPIQWIAIDEHAERYEIYINGIIDINSTWSSSIPITYQVDMLNKGTYNITIIFYDSSFNQILHSIEIIVNDNSIPIFIDYPSDFLFLENQDPIIINWTLTDNYPNQYQLFRNDHLVSEGTWNSSIPIEFSVWNLLEGDYNYSIFVWDESLNNNSISFVVTVLDKTKPNILSSSPDQLVIYGTNGNEIEWNVIDNHPKTYIILKNDKQSTPNVWLNGFPISLNLDDLTVGNYNFTIIIFDESDNSSTHTVLVRVKDSEVTDTFKPEVTISKNVYPNDLEILKGNWLDIESNPIVNASIYTSLLDGEQEIQRLINFTSLNGHYELLFDYSNIAPGQYIWKIEFQKYLYQTQIIFVEFTIHPNSYIVEIETLSELQQGKAFEIIAKVYYNNSREFKSESLGLNQLIYNSDKPVGVLITFTITYIDENNKMISTIIESQTASNGNAIVILSADETKKISEINGISASIIEDVFSNPTTFILPKNEMPDIASPELELLPEIKNYIIDNILVIISLFSLLSAGVFIIFNIRKNLKRKSLQVMDNIKLAHVEIGVLQSLQALIIQTSSGLPVYDKQFINIGVDSILISGMSTAISGFLSELDSSHIFGFEIMERENLSISSHKLDHSSIVIISRQKLPFIMLDQIKKAHMLIENKFSLAHRAGGVQELNKNEVEDLYEKAGFKVGLLDNLTMNKTKIVKIKRNKSLSRLLRQKIDLFLNFHEELNEETFVLEQLLSFLKNKDIFEDVANTLVSLMYIYGGLVPLTDFQL
ncbi:MAG: hypothetical protein HeimC2_02450 [Candidatus Heimdallarchaeota archaeon LC_2]|nr:MAG: hypothetical protein HeimC2_02450 [Candidatus Heimdallarchaeota archaeon LC_2]